MIRFMIYTALMLWFANLTGIGKIDPWWGTFATFVFMREMARSTRAKGRKMR